MSSHRFEHELQFNENGIKDCFSVFAQGVWGSFMATGVSQQQCSSQAENKKECRRFLSWAYFCIFFSGLGLVSQILLQHKMSLNNISELVFYFLYWWVLIIWVGKSMCQAKAGNTCDFMWSTHLQFIDDPGFHGHELWDETWKDSPTSAVSICP